MDDKERLGGLLHDAAECLRQFCFVPAALPAKLAVNRLQQRLAVTADAGSAAASATGAITQWQSILRWNLVRDCLRQPEVAEAALLQLRRLQLRRRSWPTSFHTVQQQQQHELQQGQQVVQLRQLSLWLVGPPSQLPVMPGSCLQHVTHLRLAVPQALLPHLSWLLPGHARSPPARKSAAERLYGANNNSSGSHRLWSKLRNLELSLDREDGGGPYYGLWQAADHYEQANALEHLLSSSSSLQCLRLEGSRGAGVDLLRDLESLSGAAPQTLRELQIVNTVPAVEFERDARTHATRLTDMPGAIPYLGAFKGLQKLCLARTAAMMRPLGLHFLPASLREAHLEGFGVRFWSGDFTDLVRRVRTSLESTLTEQQQVARSRTICFPPGATEAQSQDIRMYHWASANDTRLADSWCKATQVMPQLQQLRLVNCFAADQAHGITLQQLVKWAGPQLQQLVLANVHKVTQSGRPRETASQEQQQQRQQQNRRLNVVGNSSCLPGFRQFETDSQEEPPLQQQQQQQHDGGQDMAGCMPLVPELRSFMYISSSIAVSSCQPGTVSNILGFLQANAPELQQLVLAADERSAVTDEHVPQLLNMHLRQMELFVGRDIRSECAAQWQQQQQLQSRNEAAAAAAIAAWQRQQQQQGAGAAVADGAASFSPLVAGRLQVFDAMQHHAMQAVQHARFLQELLRGSCVSTEDAQQVVGPAHGLMCELQRMAGFLSGMSASAAAQLRECGGGGVHLHRQWHTVDQMRFSICTHGGGALADV